VSKKKNKFDLSQLVHDGYLKEGEKVSFVSDPSKFATVVKLLNKEYKLIKPGEKQVPITAHAFAQECLGQEPPDHASKWLKGSSGKTLYELWHAEDADRYAA
jgi:hypothetical protein